MLTTFHPGLGGVGRRSNRNQSLRTCLCQFSRVAGKKNSYEPRKKPAYFPLYWLFNRDPYNGLL